MQPYLAGHLQLTVLQQHVSYIEPDCPMLSGLAAHVQLTAQQPMHAHCVSGVWWHLPISLKCNQTVPVAADDEDFDSPAGRSRARYDSSLSLAGLDISSPDFDSTGGSSEQVQALSALLPALPRGLQPLACGPHHVSCGSHRAATWPPAHPLISAAQKSPVDVWTPSSGANISAAAAGNGLLVACCSDFKVMCLSLKHRCP